jgi:hypothetical protein
VKETSPDAYILSKQYHNQVVWWWKRRRRRQYGVITKLRTKVLMSSPS